MARSRKHDGVVFRRKESKVWWIRYRDRNGERRRESTFTDDWNEAQKRLRERLQARDDNILEVVRKGESLNFGQWVDFFLENYSKPPMRAERTHQINLRVAKHLKSAFTKRRLADVTGDDVELYLRERLRQRVRIKSSLGYRDRGPLQPATVHQEFRVLRRMLNVAVRKRLLPANPCSGVEFPVAVRGLFRPHYVSWSEQQQIEAHAPEHLRNIIRVITETGLRVFKELLSMKKEQVDLHNAVVWIPDSKTPNGISRSAADTFGGSGVQGPNGELGTGAVLVSERPQSEWTPKESENRLAKKHFDGPAFPTFGFTICARPTPHG